VIIGVPGLSTLFYLLSVLAMPLYEAPRALHGRSSRRRGWAIIRHTTLSAIVVLGVWLVSENHPEIDALGRDGDLYAIWMWALKVSGALLVLLVLLPWLNRMVRSGYRRLGWGCLHSRHPHPGRPHPSILAKLCPDCGNLMFQVRRASSGAGRLRPKG
jgi:hypothetical protein